MTEGRDPDLTAYLKAHPTRRGGSGKAWCCLLPPEILAQVEESVASYTARGDPVPWATIAHWLESKGILGVRRHRVQFHFAQKHHERRDE